MDGHLQGIVEEYEKELTYCCQKCAHVYPKHQLRTNQTDHSKCLQAGELTYDDVYSVVGDDGRRFKKDSRQWLHKSSSGASQEKNGNNCVPFSESNTGIDSLSLDAISKLAICDDSKYQISRDVLEQRQSFPLIRTICDACSDVEAKDTKRRHGLYFDVTTNTTMNRKQGKKRKIDSFSPISVQGDDSDLEESSSAASINSRTSHWNIEEVMRQDGGVNNVLGINTCLLSSSASINLTGNDDVSSIDTSKKNPLEDVTSHDVWFVFGTTDDSEQTMQTL